MTNQLAEKLLEEGFSETDDDMLFRYAEWWGNSNANLPEDNLWDFFQKSFGYQMYLDRGYVILEDD